MLLCVSEQPLVVNLSSSSKGDRPHLFKVIIILVGYIDNASTSNRFIIPGAVATAQFSSSRGGNQVMAQQVGQRGEVNALDILGEILELGNS